MQPGTPANLTLEEHRQLARELHATRAQLRELASLIVSLYGLENSAATSFLNAVEAMDRLCEDLQRQAARDLPGIPLDGLYH